MSRTRTIPRPEGDLLPPPPACPVLMPLPLPGALDYAVTAPPPPGTYVVAPVSGRETIGVVWEPRGGDEPAPAAKLKPLGRVLDLPPMKASMRRFIERAARYTLTPPGMMLRQATRAPGLAKPPAMRDGLEAAEAPGALSEARRRVWEAARERPLLSAAALARASGSSPSTVRAMVKEGALRVRKVAREAPASRLDPAHAKPRLSAEQREAATAISDAVAARRYETLLLDGVTGSGKTETYLEAVAEALRRGRQALILLPEIALTADFIRRVEARFGAPPVEWHSGVSPAARAKAWRAVASGEAKVVAGARSALFLPFADLALIVVDEEHDASYKQEDVVLYQARDLAVLRAAEEGCACVLASATPSLESWVNAEAGKYRRLTLTERHGPAVLPFLQAVDIREDPPERDRWLTPTLVEATREALERGEQALFFLNRRGYAPLTICRNCGWRAGCPHCSAWLVEHRGRGTLLCHQCGHTRTLPERCPECAERGTLTACGPGVERIAEEAAERFPLAEVALLSSDLSPDPAHLRRTIAEIAEGKADIVVGTQIVAKGHNFPKLTVVGVIDADLGLMGGDLRAAERTFQMLNQVAGRAGRADRPGRALIQTAQPDHPVMTAILEGDAPRFRRRLAEERREAGMPPYARLVAVIVRSEDEEAAWRAACALAGEAGALTEAGADLFGPAPAPFAMLRGEHRFRLLARFPRQADHPAALAAWRDRVKVPSKVRVVFDVDPYSFL